MGENIKAVFAEDEEKSKPENLENIEKKDGSVKSAEEAAIFPVTF